MRTKKELIAQRDPKSPISEVFRTLRTNIQFMSTSKKLKTLLITSTFPGEGKSWVASNLAVTFAQAGNKVILIDADMRKGRQHMIFGASPRPGLSNYLSGVDAIDSQENDISDYIQKTEIENLLLIATGNIPPNPSELLLSEQMAKLLDELKEVCDIIIVDGTPCELVTDSVILSRIADSTLIVTAHKQTKKDNLERVIKSIQNVGGKLAGVVINKMPVSVKKYNEKYYYNSESMQSSNNKNKRNINVKTNNVITKSNNIKNKASDAIKQNRKENAYIDIKKKINDIDIPTENDTLETPNFIKSKDKSVSIDKTKDILNQINSYLDQEKKNLN